MAKKLTRFVIAYDNHGSLIDPKAETAFRGFVADFRPTLRIHGGDAFDFTAWRRGAGVDDKLSGMKEDVERGTEFLAWFKPHVWTLGNHDDRLIRVMENDHLEEKRMLASILWDAILHSIPKCQTIHYGKFNFYRLGDYKVMHGVHHGEHAARQAAQSYGNVIAGHVHRPDTQSAPHVDGATGYTSGCLCRLDMDYNKTHANTLAQKHGWIYGWVTASGHTAVYHAKQVGDRWFYPTEQDA